MKQIKTIFLSSLVTLVFAVLFFTYFYANGQDSAPRLNEAQFSQVSNDSVDNREANQSKITNGRQNIITKTVQEVSEAVVGINVTEIRQYRDPLSMDPVFRYFFGDRVYKQQVKGLGSGAIISPDGYIITNDHVAGNGVEIIVTMTNGMEYNAKVIGTDPVSDICLLKIDEENLPYIRFGNSDDLLIGEWVIALGNPFGLFEINDKPTVTVGVISATGMNLNSVNNRFYINMIQTDAAINGGNSGGPLVNSIGEFIGMNTLIYTANGSSGNVGVGFAIPVNKVKEIMEILKTDGSVDRDFWTGLQIQTIDKQIAKYFDLKSTKGVIVTHVMDNSPAQKAGLEVRDIILEVGNFKINNDESMISALHEYRTGDSVKLKVFRNNQTFTKYMKLEKNQ